MVRKEYEHKAKLVNGLPVLYCKFGKNKPWVNITSSRFKITLFTFIDSDNVKHNISECEVTLNELVVKIVFKFEVNEIMFDDVESWRFCYCFWSGYPSCILFDLVKNEFKLVFDHGIERILDTKIQYIGPESGGVVDISKDSKSGSKPGLVLTINVFDEKPSVITAGPELLWERLPGEPVAERMITDKETDEIVIFCKDRYFVCRRENGKRSREEHKLTQFHHEIINSFIRTKQTHN
ncbi:hypothetical protein TpMuguga_02g02455 [Theileria parva strain Muguga]|uniref:uncharacterized protein n=1 Tax=Theileria parva strain Muguga TaxID=333668 RepID=UPI001C62026A|nr:uncharacterized protein TpMuguga_02g02455 [Theileria parva strain Muguga]KAF5153664.1 hypothetical protein TpMuguga_02g02455 [Theileria parva strain Muguga]